MTLVLGHMLDFKRPVHKTSPCQVRDGPDRLFARPDVRHAVAKLTQVELRSTASIFNVISSGYRALSILDESYEDKNSYTAEKIFKKTTGEQR